MRGNHKKTKTKTKKLGPVLKLSSTKEFETSLIGSNFHVGQKQGPRVD